MRARRWFIAVLLALPLYLQAAPLGYVINSDAVEDADQLLQVDLATGEYTVIGQLQLPYEDTEALALSPDGVLYAVDDNTDTLLTLSTSTGVAKPVGDNQNNLGFSTASGDYGLTFTCDGRLIMSSDQTARAYQLDLATGRASQQSTPLSTGMTALANWGDDIYGVGVDGDENLYRIDPSTGDQTLVGALQTPTFNDAGLAFDADGNLWLITDGTVLSNGRVDYGPSRIYKVNTQTGKASFVAETVGGVESLAIAAGTGCNRGPGAVPVPTLTLQNQMLLVLLLSFLAMGFLPRNQY